MESLPCLEAPGASGSGGPDASRLGDHHHRREPWAAELRGHAPPDLVGLTAFTSQASRAYEVAREFRSRGVSVVMGGIHATMCTEEALRQVDSVVTG